MSSVFISFGSGKCFSNTMTISDTDRKKVRTNKRCCVPFGKVAFRFGAPGKL